MPEMWMPGAVKRSVGNTGAMNGGSKKATWHATSNINADGKSNAFELESNYFANGGKGSAPHLIWDPFTGQIAQYFPANSRALALRNYGSNQTNRSGTYNIQIEVVFASGMTRDGKKYTHISETPCKGLDKIMAWLRSLGIADTWPGGAPTGWTRDTVSWAMYDGTSGHYGHHQVPGNDHTDPGKMPNLFATTPTVPTTPSPTGTHKVVAGDTLWALATKYKVTVAQLKTWNGLKSDDLEIGQVLKVKAPAPTTPPKPVYNIPGTWLWFENVAPGTGKTNSTLMVQVALKYEFPDFNYSSGPGIFGPKTQEYYAKWQRRLGHTGDAADGLPGKSSLEALAKKYGFDVRYKAASPSRVASPVPGKSVTFAYGVKRASYAAGYHTGEDYAAPTGTPVVAVRAGTIQWSNSNGGAYGNWIGLKADNGRVYVYCHLSTRSVGVGQKVSAGQQIGKVGATGNVTGPHLHFEDHPSGPFVYGKGRKPLW